MRDVEREYKNQEVQMHTINILHLSLAQTGGNSREISWAVVTYVQYD